MAVLASIDNNLPGTELAVGADTALNVDVASIDMIKMSGAATTRCFVVETMGRYCGFLALMSGIAGGAERVYLNEEGVELGELAYDVAWLQRSFAAGRRLFLAIRNEEASDSYTTEFMGQMLEGASNGNYDVRTHIIGHLQQGGEPTAVADRLLAARGWSAPAYDGWPKRSRRATGRLVRGPAVLQDHHLTDVAHDGRHGRAPPPSEEAVVDAAPARAAGGQ